MTTEYLREKSVCADLREISRTFLRESSRLRIFVRGVNAKKELFSWADLYVYTASRKLLKAGYQVCSIQWIKCFANDVYVISRKPEVCPIIFPLLKILFKNVTFLISNFISVSYLIIK